ncbi:uncharacterized protein LOC102074849 [Zonotrichia albicollis]|uniref:uncharacterized protein LOC102074849 n=1 Tax=Zonotrichia albicollis TaxID=44394 RepID=UPI003D80F8B0
MRPRAGRIGASFAVPSGSSRGARDAKGLRAPMAPAPRTRTGPTAGGATLAFPGDPSSRLHRVLKWWVGRPPSSSFTPCSRPVPPPAPRSRSPPVAPAPAPRGSRPSVRPGPDSAGIRRKARASPGNTATAIPGTRQRRLRRPPLPAPGSHRGAGASGDRPRRPSAATSPSPCVGPQVCHECRARLQVSRAHLQEGRRAALIGVRDRRPRSDGTAARQGRVAEGLRRTRRLWTRSWLRPATGPDTSERKDVL